MFNSFAEQVGIKGHLTIHKVVNGQEELLYDEDNVIVSGFGWALSHLYAKLGSDRVTDYQIDRFKLGVSGSQSLQVSTTMDVSGALSEADYLSGDSGLEILTANRWENDTPDTDNIFARIPYTKVTRVDDRTVRYTILIDENSCNDLAADKNLNEIGLFIKNPKANSTETSVMAAYRSFSNIRKTSDFAIVFRWTISFG
jgi:hypothetical protein